MFLKVVHIVRSHAVHLIQHIEQKQLYVYINTEVIDMRTIWTQSNLARIGNIIDNSAIDMITDKNISCAYGIMASLIST